MSHGAGRVTSGARLGLLLLIAALAACASPQGSPSSGASTLAATPTPRSTALGPLDLTTIPMFVLNIPMGGDETLQVGFADGRITRELTLKTALRRWYAYSWMTAGRMAYAVSDPDLTEIHVITAATGEVSTFKVKGHPTINIDLVLAPDGMSVYYIGRERVTPDLPGNPDIGPATGVWRVDLRGGGVPVRILPPAAPTGTDPLRKDLNRVSSQLFMTRDGATLVASDFVGSDPARIRVVDLATGAIADVSTAAIEVPLGVSGRVLVGLARLAETSPLVVLDLDSGAPRQIALVGPLGGTIERLAPIGAYIDNGLRLAGKTELHVIDLSSGVQAIVYRNQKRAYLPGSPAEIEAPPDWIFLEPQQCFPLPPDNFGALLNWRTGELIPLGMEEAPPGQCQG